MKSRKSSAQKKKTAGCFCLFDKKNKKSGPSVPIELDVVNPQKLWDHPDNLYSSPEERDFCEQFRVYGKLDTYPIWHQFSGSLPRYLSEQSHHRMILEIRNMFGLQTQPSAIAKHFNDVYSTVGSTNQLDTTPTATRDEAEIWHIENIILLLEKKHTEYGINTSDLHHFAKHFYGLLEAIDELNEKHQLPPRYDTVGAREMARNRLWRFIDSIDEELNLHVSEDDRADLTGNQSKIKLI